MHPDLPKVGCPGEAGSSQRPRLWILGAELWMRLDVLLQEEGARPVVTWVYCLGDSAHSRFRRWM